MSVVLLCLGLGGCLVPQSVDPITSQHTVPIIDLSSVPSYLMTPGVPLYLQGTNDSPTCHCVLQLEIPVVTDPDPTVDLEARWFVDYDLGTPNSQNPLARVNLPGSFTPTGLTRGPVPFVFDADGLGLKQGTHIIEVVIAEAAGFPADNDPNQTFPHRSTKTGWDATTFKIVVNVSPSTSNQCDQNTPLSSPPLARVGQDCAQ